MKKITYLYIFLFIIVIGVHIQWFNFSTILTDGDFFYIPINALKEIRADYFSTWLSDFQLGRPLIDISQAPTYFLPGFFANFFGWDYRVSERIVYFLPILFFGLYGSYRFFNYIFKGDKLAVLAGISIYFLNTYSLSLQTGHITLAAAYSVFPLAFYFLHRGLIENKVNNIIISSLLFLLLGYYETRLLFITGIILFFYFCYLLITDFKKYYKYIFLLSVLVILGNLFWLLPFKFLGLEGEGTLSRPLFGAGYWDLLASMTLHQPWWNFSKGIEVFIKTPTHTVYFIYPLLFVISILVFSKNKKHNIHINKLFLVFVSLGLLGIFLGKMTAPPFGFIYSYLYNNFPFFNAFREPTKFYLITSISFSIIIGFFIYHLKGYKKVIISSILIFLGIYNLYIQYSFNKQLLKPKEIPKSYNIINNYIEKDKGFGRILSVPRYPRWLDYSKKHPPINMVNTVLDITKNNFGYIENRKGIDFYRNQKHFFDSRLSYDTLQKLGIKYIILPEEDINNFNFFIHYGKREKNDIWNDYYSLLKKQKYLQEIELGTKTKVFLLNGYKKTKISINSGDLSIGNRGQHFYNITINFHKKNILRFLESFHPQWKLYLEPYSQIDCKNPKTYAGTADEKLAIYTIQGEDTLERIAALHKNITLEKLQFLNPSLSNENLKIGEDIYIPDITAKQETYKVTECESENTFYAGGELSKPWEKTIFDESHKKVYDYANGWTLDADYIKKNYRKEYYKENPDGSIDIKMKLYFKPQGYFYLGLIVSVTTFLLLILWLIVGSMRDRKSTKK